MSTILDIYDRQNSLCTPTDLLHTEFEPRFRFVFVCCITNELYPGLVMWLDKNSKKGIQIKQLENSKFCIAFESKDDALFFKIKYL